MHDISSTTQAKRQRLHNKQPFSHPDDPRLKWLVDQTTMATVSNIPYLLSKGIDFVLTRKFTSDNIERLFSSLRQCNGGNYNMDAKSAVEGVEKVLRTGISNVSIDCNVSLETDKITKRKEIIPAESTKVVQSKKRAQDLLNSLPVQTVAALHNLKKTDCKLILTTYFTTVVVLIDLNNKFIIFKLTGVRTSSLNNIEKASVSYFAGYVLRVLKEKLLIRNVLNASTNLKNTHLQEKTKAATEYKI